MGAKPHLEGVQSIAPKMVGLQHTPPAGRGEEQDRRRTALLLQEDIAAVRPAVHNTVEGFAVGAHSCSSLKKIVFIYLI